MVTPSPFAGCRTEAELRAQLTALNRIAYYAALVLAPSTPPPADDVDDFDLGCEQ